MDTIRRAIEIRRVAAVRWSPAGCRADRWRAGRRSQHRSSRSRRRSCVISRCGARQTHSTTQLHWRRPVKFAWVASSNLLLHVSWRHHTREQFVHRVGAIASPGAVEPSRLPSVGTRVWREQVPMDARRGGSAERAWTTVCHLHASLIRYHRRAAPHPFLPCLGRRVARATVCCTGLWAPSTAGEKVVVWMRELRATHVALQLTTLVY